MVGVSPGTSCSFGKRLLQYQIGFSAVVLMKCIFSTVRISSGGTTCFVFLLLLFSHLNVLFEVELPYKRCFIRQEGYFGDCPKYKSFFRLGESKWEERNGRSCVMYVYMDLEMCLLKKCLRRLNRLSS